MPEAADHQATDETKWQWMLKVGIGGVLIVGILPWMMYLITLSFKSGAESTQAITKAADAMDDLAVAVHESVAADTEFRKDLSPLIRQLDRVADAVEAVAEQPASANEGE